MIPCLNEAEGLRELLPKLRTLVDEIVVVDNASTDDTAAVARSMGARVIREEINVGYGRAYKLGLPAATGEIFITMDGDGTYPCAVIPEAIAFMERRKLDFVNCARFPLRTRRVMPWKNYVGNRLTTLATRLVFRFPLADSLSGMWVIRKKILSRILPQSDEMAFSLEIKVNAIIADDVRFGEYYIPYRGRAGGLLPLFAGWEGIFGGALASRYFPQQIFFARCLGRGVVPWWDPSVFAGASPV
ncbi:MAG: glycosyltransferase family 2 protein [Candidatus Aureabacteria bacterium]|nr:glycosyltransferase family 2 protein [Candidatus Auribacterota bacterium]